MNYVYRGRHDSNLKNSKFAEVAKHSERRIFRRIGHECSIFSKPFSRKLKIKFSQCQRRCWCQCCTELPMPIFPNVQWSTNINRTNNSWNRFGVQYSVLDVFMYFWMVALNSQQMKILQSGNRSHDIPRRKHFRPTKYPRGKFRAREIATKAQQHNDSRSAIHPMARD